MKTLRHLKCRLFNDLLNSGIPFHGMSKVGHLDGRLMSTYSLERNLVDSPWSHRV